jgi:hypothetical protein
MDNEVILTVTDFLLAYYIFLSNGTFVLTPWWDLRILKNLRATYRRQRS